jgi:hypothetical protein
MIQSAYCNEIARSCRLFFRAHDAPAGIGEGYVFEYSVHGCRSMLDPVERTIRNTAGDPTPE